MQRVVKAKTRRSKVALQQRAPLLVENPKSILYVHGGVCSQVVQKTFKDLHAITKPQSVIFSKKHEVRPFEDCLPLENMGAQHDVSLLAFGSHNKKRPHNITFVRMFDHHLLDMAELGVQRVTYMSEFKNAKNMLGSKPCLVFLGSMFTVNPDYVHIQNLLADFFRGPVVEHVNLAGLDHALVFTALEDGSITLRHYRVALKKSGSRLPLADLEEIGPSIDFVVRRHQWAAEELWKQAIRVPRELKPKKVKNISHLESGDRVGQVHMDSQDLGKLQTRKVKALKRTRKEVKEIKDKRSRVEAPEAVAMEE